MRRTSSKKTNRILMLRRMLASRFFMIGSIVAVILVLLALFAPVIINHDPIEANMRMRFHAPDWFSQGSDGYILGTDSVGRDIFSRVLIGARYSLSIALVVAAIALVFGSILGIISGYYGGIVDSIIMRLCDTLGSIPQMVLAMAFIAVLGDSLAVFIGILAFTSWVGFTRQIRSSVLVMRNREFISASKVLGARTPHIMFTQILPNVVTPLLILISQHIGMTILVEASISYLGLGIRAPTPSWGNMISDGRSYLATSPWCVVVPGVALMITVLAFNFLGDGLRDVLDPKRQ